MLIGKQSPRGVETEALRSQEHSRSYEEEHHARQPIRGSGQ